MVVGVMGIYCYCTIKHNKELDKNRGRVGRNEI